MANKYWDNWLKEQKAMLDRKFKMDYGNDWKAAGTTDILEDVVPKVKEELADLKEKASKNEDGKKTEWLARAKLKMYLLEQYQAVKTARELSNKKQSWDKEIVRRKNELATLGELGQGNGAEAQKLKARLTQLQTWVAPVQSKLDKVVLHKGDKPVVTTTPDTKAAATKAAADKAAADKAAADKAAADKAAAAKAAAGKGTSKGTGAGSGSGSGSVTPKLTDAEERAQALNVAAETEFTLPETLFKRVPSLNKLLDRYVKEDWTPDKLRKAIRDDLWFRKNQGEIKARYVQLYNYDDLVKSGQDATKTDYAKQIETIKRQLINKARKMGSGLASDPDALDKAARDMYITNVGVDDPMTNDFIAAAIRPITSTLGGKITEGYSGEALKDYQAIQAIAKANGFKISDILPGGQNEVQVLQGLAKGTIDADRLAQDARKLAAQGQPQYVRDLLGQGYNLDQVYAPYKQTMAAILEVNPEEISLNDQTLRSAITDKGDMNMYDFKKALRRDDRWQYTEQARADVSNGVLKVLRDFGFQG